MLKVPTKIAISHVKVKAVGNNPICQPSPNKSNCHPINTSDIELLKGQLVRLKF